MASNGRMYRQAISLVSLRRGTSSAKISRRFFSPSALIAKPAVAADVDYECSISSKGNEIIPSYLKEVYWWAYLHPNAIRVFERQWLVDAILFGNFGLLRDAALRELAGGSNATTIAGKTLQIACVYGDFTQRLVDNMANDDSSSLDVVDVAPIQIQNLRRKLANVVSETTGVDPRKIQLWQQNAADLDLGSKSFDQVILFFLLHEMPVDVRRATLRHAIRVLRPGGKLVIVDYHQPTSRLHPHRYLMPLVLRALEPFAMDLWSNRIEDWLPDDQRIKSEKELFFGGLYQKLVLTKESS